MKNELPNRLDCLLVNPDSSLKAYQGLMQSIQPLSHQLGACCLLAADPKGLKLESLLLCERLELDESVARIAELSPQSFFSLSMVKIKCWYPVIGAQLLPGI